ncbi:hypothetical protein C0Z18_17710 [Trinickia dabaoshanensis]|uniref:Uncharacterized protein n=1 Tax=Trinickia dabaoshanensis TaxID=564714 RepID=A0A2N7VLR2_9BURK|nr:hypothetical protein C0Z18_17710 [Trinickia dabaoshanensis]
MFRACGDETKVYKVYRYASFDGAPVKRYRAGFGVMLRREAPGASLRRGSVRAFAGGKRVPSGRCYSTIELTVNQKSVTTSFRYSRQTD